MERKRPVVAVIGAGFGGLAVVRALEAAPVDLVLIDQRNHHLFQPLLYQVATGGLNPGDVTHFLRSLRAQQPNLDVVHEHLMEIDTDARTVRLLDGQEMPYDYLLIANGVTTAYHGTPGAKENSFAVYSRSQAIAIRDTLFTRLERAAVPCDRETTGLQERAQLGNRIGGEQRRGRQGNGAPHGHAGQVHGGVEGERVDGHRDAAHRQQPPAPPERSALSA